MMQQVASIKSEIAAFAASDEQSQQSSNNSSFEQVFQQHAKEQNTNSRPEKASSTNREGAKYSRSTGSEPIKRESKVNDKANDPHSELAAKDNTASPAATTKKSETKSQANEDTQENVYPTEKTQANTSIRPAEKQQEVVSAQDRQSEDAHKVNEAKANEIDLLEDNQLTDSDNEQVENAEDWVELVAQLSMFTQQEQITAERFPDSKAALENWLLSQDDKQEALNLLLENQPELALSLTDMLGDDNSDLAEKLGIAIQSLKLDENAGLNTQQRLSDVNLKITDIADKNKRDASSQTDSKVLSLMDKITLQIDKLIADKSLSEEQKKALNDAVLMLKNTEVTSQDKGMLAALAEKLDSIQKASSINPSNIAAAEALSGLSLAEGKHELTPSLNKELTQNTGQVDKLIADIRSLMTQYVVKEPTQLKSNSADNLNSLVEFNPANNTNNSDVKKLDEAELESAQLSEEWLAGNLSGKLPTQQKPLTDVQSNILASAVVKTTPVTVDKSELDKTNSSDSGVSDELENALQSLLVKVSELSNEQAKSAHKSLSVYKLSGEIGQDVAKNDKVFLSVLKVGIEEFKDQLKAGHEPGLDLKDLVAEALTKVDDVAISAKVKESLEPSLRALNQSLVALTHMSQSLESHHSQTALTNGVDILTNQSEQAKATAFHQFDNKLDKAINLLKPEGQQQLAEKMRWMVNTNNLVADIRLDPAELGSVQVRVSLSSDAASVNFVVQSHQTRDALESATPKLRELLAEKGIELGQSSVRQENQNKQDSQGQLAQRGANAQQANTDFDDVADESLLLNQHNLLTPSSGSIDYFV